MNRKIVTVILVSLMATGAAVKGQVSFSGEEITSLLNNGYEMYGKAKYAAAIGLFDKWLENEKTGNIIQRAERSIMRPGLNEAYGTGCRVPDAALITGNARVPCSTRPGLSRVAIAISSEIIHAP